jgi:hypothetical protein
MFHDEEIFQTHSKFFHLREGGGEREKDAPSDEPTGTPDAIRVQDPPKESESEERSFERSCD